MAGDWIKMRRSLLTDPRVVRISSALDADRFRTIGGLFSAWCLFDEQTSDGHLSGYTPQVFDEIVGIDGLAKAMAAVGWLEIRQDSLIATAFCEHNGQSAKRRAQEAVRKMSARDADTNADRKRPREEKRREEKNSPPPPPAKRETAFVPPELAEAWNRWQEFTLATQGKSIPDIQAEAILMDLSRRGADKANRDIDFSIRKGAKSIIDSDNDFDARQSTNRTKKKHVEI